jgi:hypothetical protein
MMTWTPPSPPSVFVRECSGLLQLLGDGGGAVSGTRAGTDWCNRKINTTGKGQKLYLFHFFPPVLFLFI